LDRISILGGSKVRVGTGFGVAGPSADAAKTKTKIRRLYDIANILTSLHLITKVMQRQERF
jgi:E2F/DP family winged-helix DNA-binding domain